MRQEAIPRPHTSNDVRRMDPPGYGQRTALAPAARPAVDHPARGGPRRCQPARDFLVGLFAKGLDSAQGGSHVGQEFGKPEGHDLLLPLRRTLDRRTDS